jgi:transcriptional regulator with XRE-family HTH domain
MPKKKPNETALPLEGPLNSRGQRLVALRKLLGFSITDFAKKAGVGYSTLKMWEAGKIRELSDKGAHIITRLVEREGIKCEAQWLLHGIGAAPKLDEKTNEFAASSIALPNANLIDQKEVAEFKSAYPKGLILTISDLSMSPAIMPGDVVAGETLFSLKERQKLHKNICLIQLKNDLEPICRWLENSSEEKEVYLVPFNFILPEYPVKKIALKAISKITSVTRIWKGCFD